ncbi:MAG TPA: ribosome maturation factor RimP [Gammaproteobacteria bacterium]|nr:ribosome maturation factor RimP [Gammaproteobacteria bacterium]
MEQSNSKEWKIVEPVVESMGYELVGVELMRHGRECTLRVYIDKPAGVTLDDCAAVSHQLSGVMDVEDPIQSAYRLEISSPGLDRPLFKAADFERFAGSAARIKLAVPLAGRRNFTGILSGMQDGRVKVQVDGEIFELNFDHIERARLVPQF